MTSAEGKSIASDIVSFANMISAWAIIAFSDGGAYYGSGYGDYFGSSYGPGCGTKFILQVTYWLLVFVKNLDIYYYLFYKDHMNIKIKTNN